MKLLHTFLSFFRLFACAVHSVCDPHSFRPLLAIFSCSLLLLNRFHLPYFVRSMFSMAFIQSKKRFFFFQRN